MVFSLIIKEQNLCRLVRAALKHQPDLVLVDIGLPHLDGITVTKQIRAKLPNLKPASNNNIDSLSEREIEVLELIVEGKSNP